MVSVTVGTGDSGSDIGMEVVVGREPGCWVGEGLWEAAGKEQGRVQMSGTPGVGTLEVTEWAEGRCSADFVS